MKTQLKRKNLKKTVMHVLADSVSLDKWSAFIFDNSYQYSSKISAWPDGTFLIPQNY